MAMIPPVLRRTWHRHRGSVQVRLFECYHSRHWVHHVVFVFDGTDTGDNGRLKIYMNGTSQPIMFFGTCRHFTATAADLTIGQPTSDMEIYAHYSDGLIDDVKIWNYALTPEQVKKEYNGGAVKFGN